MNPFYVPFLLEYLLSRASRSYLAGWSYDYLCEKLDLTCKRNHISSFIFYFSMVLIFFSLIVWYALLLLFL